MEHHLPSSASHCSAIVPPACRVSPRHPRRFGRARRRCGSEGIWGLEDRIEGRASRKAESELRVRANALREPVLTPWRVVTAR